ncbi:MAG: FTR1 family protein [Campylobacter sp.]
MRVFVAFLMAFITFAFARVDDYYAESKIIKDLINESISLYEKGDNLGAKKLAEDAYFQHFENMEGPAARNVGRRAISMERKFTTLRRYYKEKVDIKKIKALVDGLYFDLDEVVPLIQNGFKLSAEVGDTNFDQEKAKLSAREAEKGRMAVADDIFARINGESARTNDENSSAEIEISSQKQEQHNQTQNEQNIEKMAQKDDISTLASNDEAVANLQSATAIDPKLQALYDNISLKFDETAIAFREKNIAESKRLLDDALFNDYRNSKLEIAINKFTKNGLDQQIQQSIRKVRSELDSNITERDLRAKFEEIENKLFDALLLIPNDQISQIRVAGFDTTTQNTTDYKSVASEISQATNKLLQNYGDVATKASIDELQAIYLDTFEATGMENKVGAIDTSLKLKIESYFTKGVALIKSSASKDELKKCFDELNELVAIAAEKTSSSTPWVLFLSSFSILLREGLEALIIIVAIVSFLIQSGNKKRLNLVYSAIFSGVFLSFVTAFVIYYAFRSIAGQFRELLEGVTFLIAVFLLLYVAFWMLHKASDQKWATSLKTKASGAISSGESKALWISVFLAVFREGAECVLFYQALLFDANTSADFGAIFGGLGVALATLIVLYFALKTGAIKIPVKLFFSATSYVIFVLCVIFTGKGIAELIEGKIFTPTFTGIKFSQIPDLGIYPYYETIIPQILVCATIIIGVVITKKLSKARR